MSKSNNLHIYTIQRMAVFDTYLSLSLLRTNFCGISIHLTNIYCHATHKTSSTNFHTEIIDSPYVFWCIEYYCLLHRRTFWIWIWSYEFIYYRTSSACVFQFMVLLVKYDAPQVQWIYYCFLWLLILFSGLLLFFGCLNFIEVGSTACNIMAKLHEQIQ